LIAISALTELELEISLCSWLPWTLTENGTEWSLIPKSALLALLSGIRSLPGISAGTLTDEHKAVLLVVIGHRRKGGVSKTRIGEILSLDATPYLGELSKRELIYAAPGRELNWWRPTPEALLALGLRSIAEIPELKELENWFDSQKSYPIRVFVLVEIHRNRPGSIESRVRLSWIWAINDVCWLTATISAVAGRLLRKPSLTISCTTKVPGRSGTKEALCAVGFKIAALLPLGAETKDHL
jgi:hypothetical protein